MMVLNPFIDDFPVESIDEWVGDNELIRQLEYSVEMRTNTYIVGPEGSGKTSLLRTTFSPEYRRKMARNKRKLLYFADLSNKGDGNDLCKYLAERLEASLNFLISDKETLAEIKQSIASDSAVGRTKFQNMVEVLHDNWGYFIVIIMDYFEMFTMSETITQEHHDCLRSLMEGGCIQCIVATNYDLSKDSLPEDIRGSYALQKFTNSIEMTSFSVDDVELYLRKKQENVAAVITDAMKRHIFNLSGGIPKFVNLLARQIFENALENGSDINIGEAIKDARRQCEILMNGWCKLLTEDQIEVIQLLAAQAVNKKDYAYYDFSGSPYEAAVSSLLHRGLFKEYIYEDSNGNPVSRDFLVCFNSLLFQRYCQEDKMKVAAKSNPLVEIEKQRRKNLGKTGDTIIYAQEYYESGAIHDSKTLAIENVNVVQGLSAKEFLQMLSVSGSQEELGFLIGSNLQKHIQSTFDGEGIRRAMLESCSDIVEHDEIVDQAFDEAHQKMFQDVQVDEEEDIVDITEEELQSLEERFTAARSRIHKDLSDTIIEKQSERCQFYLKMAVVVEDALELPGIRFDDYSAQLILYGKAVEQSLRDNLFALFHGIPDLAEYSMSKKVNDSKQKDCFKKMNISKTYIGNFEHLIRDKNVSLAGLCVDIDFAMYSGSIPVDWKKWWLELANNIHDAREIRNLAGHAGMQSPRIDKLRELYKLLIGEEEVEGIMERLLIGKDLTLQHVVLPINPSVATEMIGKSLEMKCTKIKTNGGIRGKLTESGYEVNISPRKVNKYKMENGIAGEIFENDLLMVKILEFKHDPDKDYFVAEIESVI